MSVIDTDQLRLNTPVWRYMSYDRVVEMIEEQEIHFHRSDLFSDLLEGSVPRALRDMSDKTYDDVLEDNGNAKEKIESILEMMRKATFLSCWHLNAGESMAMWKLYGKSNKSVAIESTVGGLSRSIEEPNGGMTLIAPVFYADYSSDYDNLDEKSREALDTLVPVDTDPKMHELYKLKEASFRHEREVRVIYQAMSAISEPIDDDASGTNNFPFETKEGSNEPADKGFNSSIDVDELINSIRISPNSSSQVQRDLGQVLDDNESISLSSDDVLPTSLPGDPIFEAGSHMFERYVKAAPENEEKTD